MYSRILQDLIHIIHPKNLKSIDCREVEQSWRQIPSKHTLQKLVQLCWNWNCLNEEWFLMHLELFVLFKFEVFPKCYYLLRQFKLMCIQLTPQVAWLTKAKWVINKFFQVHMRQTHSRDLIRLLVCCADWTLNSYWIIIITIEKGSRVS